MMATNLSSNFELTIRSSMTASFVVHGSFNIAFFSRHHHDHPGLRMYCCSNCLQFNLTCHHHSLCNRIQDTCHCYHHHSGVATCDMLWSPGTKTDVTKCEHDIYIVSHVEVRVSDCVGWVKWVRRGGCWPHCSPDCVVVPVLDVGAGGADGGVTVTAVEPQSLAWTSSSWSLESSSLVSGAHWAPCHVGHERAAPALSALSSRAESSPGSHVSNILCQGSILMNGYQGSQK